MPQTSSSNVAIGKGALNTTVCAFGNVVIGDSAGGFICEGAIGNVVIGFDAGRTNALSDNNILIGRNALAAVAGATNSITFGDANITVIRSAVTSITALSDARDKTDITALPVGLDFVNSLKPVKFTWELREPNEVKDGTSESGFIAQDLKDLQEQFGVEGYLGLVYDANPDRLEASPGKLIPVLVKAIQELSDEVTTLRSELNELKNQSNG
jgi:hypothetical protein